jgi:hypothetical protein
MTDADVTTRTDVLADAAERLQTWTYLDEPGFAFHGAMGAETLSTMGHDDLVPGWVDAYKTQHRPLPAPPPGIAIDGDDQSSWQVALGDYGRVSDWTTLFRAALAENPWEAVVRRWTPVLVPGYGGALTHGLIRTAHAVRAMPADGVPPDPLLEELARGLAFWAATYTPLPGTPKLRGRRRLTEALAALPQPVPPWTMLEAGSLSRIGELDGFPHAVEALGPPDAGDPLSELSAAFCGIVLARPDAVAIPLVHTVTPIAAMRTLQARVPDVSVDTAYTYLWHVGAAVVAALGSLPVVDGGSLDDVEPSVPTPDDVASRALECSDPHALKFTEACLREHAVHADPVYLLAAAHVTRQLPSWTP